MRIVRNEGEREGKKHVKKEKENYFSQTFPNGALAKN